MIWVIPAWGWFLVTTLACLIGWIYSGYKWVEWEEVANEYAKDLHEQKQRNHELSQEIDDLIEARDLLKGVAETYQAEHDKEAMERGKLGQRFDKETIRTTGVLKQIHKLVAPLVRGK